jgi:hypothetical protein
MAIRAPIRSRRITTLQVPIEETTPLLADVPGTLRHFPRLQQLTEIDIDVYRWDLEKLGPPSYKLPVSFATQIKVDAPARTVRLTPVPDVGNAQIGAELRIREVKGGCSITLWVSGEVLVPLPRIFARVAAPIVVREFDALVDGFTENMQRVVSASRQ